MATDTLPARAPETAPTAAQEDPYSDLMAAAISQGEAGVAALERLVALQERREAGQARMDFYAALARAKAAIGTIPHDRRGDKATYASLEQIAAHVRQPLSDNGLSYRFTAETVADPWTVTVHIVHSGGHEEQTTVRAPRGPTKLKKRDGTALEISERDILSGALKTGRRLALPMGLGLSDGDAQAPAPDVETIDDTQSADLLALITETGTGMAGFLRWLKVDHLDELPTGRYAEAVAMLETKRERQAEGPADD